MNTVEIQTYWNVETLYTVFNAVSAVMQSSGFQGVLRFVFLSAFGVFLFAHAFNKQFEIARWFLQALFLTAALNLPISRVVLTDRTGLEPPRVVEHVPFTLAFIAQGTSLVFGWLTQTYETVFNVPDDLGLQKGDVGFAHRILKQVNRATIRDPELRADLMQFIKECTIYDVRDGEIKANQIVGKTDAWDTIFANTNPARFVTYNTLTSKPVTDTCTAVSTILKPRVNEAVLAGQRYYGKQVFNRAANDGLATGLFVSAIGTSYDWVLNNSQNASEAMKQAMFNNIWREAGTELPALLNDPARVAEVNASIGSAQAALQANSTNSTLSLLAQETLPHVRNWIEAIIYALFPVVVILSVMVSAEGAKKMLAGYFMSLAWIGLWPLLFAMVNHLSLTLLQRKAKALELASGVPFQLSDAFDATLVDEQAMIGYAVMLVPFIAGIIIKLGQEGFTGMADRMMGSVSSAGASVAGHAASGNVHLGHTALDTAAINSTSMNKYDSNIGLSSGGATFSRSDGGMVTMAANGTVALQQMQNRLNYSMGLDRRFESSFNQEAHRTNIASQGDQLQSRHGQTSLLTDVKAHDAVHSENQDQRIATDNIEQGSYGGSYSAGQSLHNEARETSNFHLEAGANDAIGMNLGLGGSIEGRGGISPAEGKQDTPINNPARPSNPREERRIENAMRQGGASEEEIDKAVSNYRESRAKTLADSPSNKKQPLSPASGQGKSLQAGARFGFGFGLNSHKTYSASHGRDRNYTNSHSKDEQAREEANYSELASRSVQQSASEHSSQTNREGKDASLSTADERTQLWDQANRNEHGGGIRANRSESDVFAVHRDLMSDPSLFERVATHNGMTPMRFFNQSEDSQMDMFRDYLEEKSIVQQAKRMPEQENLPITVDQLNALSASQRAQIPNNIAELHQEKIAKTGFKSVAPLEVDIRTPEIVNNARVTVSSQLDPKSENSIPSRASKLDENVHAWASPDKPIGRGRINMMNTVEETEGHDIADSTNKLLNAAMGGEGTADGEKLTANMKRKESASLSINTKVERKK